MKAASCRSAKCCGRSQRTVFRVGEKYSTPFLIQSDLSIYVVGGTWGLQMEELRGTAKRRSPLRVSGTSVRPVLWWTGGVVLALAMLAALFWFAFQPDRSNRIATPDAPSGIAEDLTTLVGKRAPSFTLPDDQAVARTVTPGQGQSIVIIMHMGIL